MILICNIVSLRLCAASCCWKKSTVTLDAANIESSGVLFPLTEWNGWCGHSCCARLQWHKCTETPLWIITGISGRKPMGNNTKKRWIRCHLSNLLLLKYPYMFFKKKIYLFDCTRFWGFPSGSDGKECTYKAGDPCSIPALGRSLGEGNGNSFQYSCLENFMDSIGAWQATVNGVTKSRTQLNDCHQALLAECELLAVAYVI